MIQNLETHSLSNQTFGFRSFKINKNTNLNNRDRREDNGERE